MLGIMSRYQASTTFHCHHQIIIILVSQLCLIIHLLLNNNNNSLIIQPSYHTLTESAEVRRVPRGGTSMWSRQQHPADYRTLCTE